MHEELPYVREAFSLGARGYLSKAGADGELIDALVAIAGGGTYIGASLRERLSAVGPGRDLAFPELTERECEIVGMLVNGASIRQISEQLSTSRKTVYAHRSRLFQKLKIGTDVELVQLAGRRGLPGFS
jgi:two-component system invasion response regulator UvrY